MRIATRVAMASAIGVVATGKTMAQAIEIATVVYNMSLSLSVFVAMPTVGVIVLVLSCSS